MHQHVKFTVIWNVVLWVLRRHNAHRSAQIKIPKGEACRRPLGELAGFAQLHRPHASNRPPVHDEMKLPNDEIKEH